MFTQTSRLFTSTSPRFVGTCPMLRPNLSAVHLFLSAVRMHMSDVRPNLLAFHVHISTIRMHISDVRPTSLRIASTSPRFACTYAMFVQTSLRIASTSPRFVCTYAMFVRTSFPPLSKKIWKKTKTGLSHIKKIKNFFRKNTKNWFFLPEHEKKFFFFVSRKQNICDAHGGLLDGVQGDVALGIVASAEVRGLVQRGGAVGLQGLDETGRAAGRPGRDDGIGELKLGGRDVLHRSFGHVDELGAGHGLHHLLLPVKELRRHVTAQIQCARDLICVGVQALHRGGGGRVAGHQLLGKGALEKGTLDPKVLVTPTLHAHLAVAAVARLWLWLGGGGANDAFIGKRHNDQQRHYQDQNDNGTGYRFVSSSYFFLIKKKWKKKYFFLTLKPKIFSGREGRDGHSIQILGGGGDGRFVAPAGLLL